MQKLQAAALAAFATLTFSAAANAQVAVANWIELGCQAVTMHAERDLVRVGAREGRFRAVRLRVFGNDIFMGRLRVVYGSGEPDDLPVRAMIRRGTTSGHIDLKGADRIIDRIELIYQSRPSFRGEARVCVEGLQVAGVIAPPTAPPVVVVPGGGGGAWVELGCQTVGFRVDRDVVRIGRREGDFRAIRLRVSDNDVFMENVTVVYGNGEPDRLPVRALIRQGTRSNVLDLRGRSRVINRVEMIYQARRDFRGRAQVCIEGLPG